ncbi:MAG TPA: hypothetical protein VGF17_05090 [Phytomonospora sp.]
MPHSTLIRDWTSRDLSLAMADLLARDDIGPCGHPHSITTRPENEDRYAVKADVVCGGCKALAKHQASNDDHAPGALVQVVDLKDPAHDEEHTDFGPVFD